MVEMIGLLAVGRDAVDVEARDVGGEAGVELDGCFLDGFATGGGENGLILGLDVASGEEPAVEPFVVDEQDFCGRLVQDEGGGGDVSGVY